MQENDKVYRKIGWGVLQEEDPHFATFYLHLIDPSPGQFSQMTQGLGSWKEGLLCTSHRKKTIVATRIKIIRKVETMISFHSCQIVFKRMTYFILSISAIVTSPTLIPSCKKEEITAGLTPLIERKKFYSVYLVNVHDKEPKKYTAIVSFNSSSMLKV